MNAAITGEVHSPAPLGQLVAYYTVILLGCLLHLLLFILTLTHKVKHRLILLNFHLVFSLTLWFDCILLWTGHARDYTHSIPKGIRAVNVAFRLAGMVQNASNSWMIALQMLISLHTFNSTLIGRVLGYINSGVVRRLLYLLTLTDTT